VIAVLNSVGKVVAEAIIETKASTILDFLKSQRDTLHVTFEEGIQAAWLYDLIRPQVARVVVCDPGKRRNTTKADKSDASRLTIRPGRSEPARARSWRPASSTRLHSIEWLMPSKPPPERARVRHCIERVEGVPTMILSGRWELS
jgi:hypothetical protein